MTIQNGRIRDQVRRIVGQDGLLGPQDMETDVQGLEEADQDR